MDVRSGFANHGVIATVCALATACGVTSPPPLPPRRTVFPQDQAPGAPGSAERAQRPPDLARPAEPPIRHERYLAWTLAADFASLVPLTYWMGRPDDTYLALPSLLLPPLIHVVHGESRTAAISVLMRGAMIGGVYLAGRSAEAECESSNDFFCVPMRSLLLAELAIIPVVLIDSLFLARRAREDSAWRRLPVLPSVSATADGRRVLTLTGQF